MRYGRYNHQGYFAECFVRTLASAAGLIAGELDVDVTGVDFYINLPGARGTTRYPKIEVQVKSWCNPRGDAESWRYPMEVRHFNDLAGDQFEVRRFLFLVIVPSESVHYAAVETEALQLRHCGYWASLADREPLDELVQRRTTVHVPKQNMLTVPALQALMTRVPAKRVTS
jgi:hypothetical protein